MTFRMGKRAAIGMRLGNKEVYQVRQGEALVYAKYLTVSQTLDGVTSDAPQTVAWGDGLVVSFTPESGKVLLPSTVRVTMGGVDVTDTAFDFATRKVTLANVTGDVTIEAVGAAVDAEVEYLESNGVGGRAYIDTGIKVASAVTFNIEAATSTTLNCFFIGGRNGYNQQQLSVTLDFTNGNVNWGYGNKTATWRTALSATDYACSNTASSRVLVINGHSITADSATFSINHNIYLFAMNNGGTMNAGNASAVVVIKRAKIYSSGTLARDYIPVRKGNTGYLYDKVSGQLFGNANPSGVFTYGNDK